MTATPYHRKLARVLERMGGLYTLSDILARIADGRMQSFVENQSWAITEVQVFPRARQLTIVAYVGDLEDIDALQQRIFAFAGEIDVSLVAAHGRIGWAPHAAKRGWRLKARNYIYHKEL